MSIRKFIPGSAFDPDVIRNMVAAFDGTRMILNLDDPDDPLVEVVAKKIISLASQGITDPDELKRRVVTDTDRP